MFKLRLEIFVILVIALFFAGCGEKEETHKKRKDAANLGKSFDNIIEESFPEISEYMYPLSKLLSQRNMPVLKENKTYKRDLPDFMGTELIFETRDSVNIVANFFKKLLPPEEFKYKQRGGNIKAVACSYIEEETAVEDVPMEIQVKITSPASNFSKKVVVSQLSVIDKQIKQYEEYIGKQGSAYDGNVNQVSGTLQHCKDQVERLKIQYSALSNKKTIIELSFKYIYVNPKPSK